MDQISPQSHTPERSVNNDLLLTARNDFYRATAEVYDTLDQQEIDIDTVVPLTLWSKVTQQAIYISKTEYSTPENLSRGAMLEMTAEIPLYFMVDKMMQRTDTKYTRDDFMRLKHVASSFMRRIRLAGEANRDLSAEGLRDHMVQTLSKTDLTPDASYYEGLFASCVRGAQHELAAGQLLAELGPVRSATTAEDLQAIDYILDYQGSLFPIDIKASPTKVRKLNGGASDFIAVDGSRVVLYSHLTERDLGDRFWVDQETARAKSFEIAQALNTVDTTKLLIPAKV